MSRFWSPNIQQLHPYVPGEQPQDQQYIKLNTNENPYGPSPLAIDAMKQACDDNLRLYPDPDCSQLKSTLAQHFELNSNNVFVGNGSDEVLALSFQCFFEQEQNILFPDISYSFYPVYCGLYDIQATRPALDKNLAINLKDYEQKNGGIIFPNPNAPTGRYVELADIEVLLQANRDSVVIIDEAYIDFGGESAVKLIADYDNLLVVQTFSKSRSLAGIRVGYALGHPDLIDGLERVKNSFNSYPLDRPALVAAQTSIEDDAYFRAGCAKVIATREWTTTQLEALNFAVHPSKTNFVLASHASKPASELYAELKTQGILVRYFDKPRIDNELRISIGTDAEMQKFIEVLKDILEA